MKKRILILTTLLAVAMIIPACAKKETETQSQSGSLTIETPSDDTEADDTDRKEESEDMHSTGATAADDVEKDSEDGVKKVYFANENADGYQSAEIDGEVTPESIMNLLVGKQMVSDQITVLSCEETIVDGEKALNLDLSANIITELSSQGSTGESMEMGSIVNTFLSAYDCKKIQVTAEGQEIVTEHSDYSGYMTAY